MNSHVINSHTVALEYAGPLELLVIFVMVGILVLPMWRICAKAGYPGWFGLAALIPILNILLLFFLAFADWPSLRRATQHRPATDSNIEGTG